jgi:murein DD-endopeptidase MepM/ murein hydrolase activator NlpD
VVPLTVEFPADLYRIEVVSGEERFPLIRGEKGLHVALVGVDLNFEGDILPVSFDLWPKTGGEPKSLVAQLKVRKSRFGRQSLSLPTGMVDLDEEKLQRVGDESARIREAFAERNAERYWVSRFVRPVQGRLSTEFGTSRLLNGKPRSPHRGIDIAAPKGSTVVASNSGVVTMVGELYLSGRTVIVDHGWGVSTLYAHLNSVSVREGQFVRNAQPLGTVGSTGRSTGPHLHFGTVVRGAMVDPLQLIEATKGF